MMNWGQEHVVTSSTTSGELVNVIKCCVISSYSSRSFLPLSLSQWLCHKESCPQCRAPCKKKKILKLFMPESNYRDDDDETLSSMTPEQLKVRKYHPFLTSSNNCVFCVSDGSSSCKHCDNLSLHPD